MPYYHAVKLLLLVWLQSPAYEGAVRVYIEGLRPWLLRWQPALDDTLAALLRAFVSGAGRGGGPWTAGRQRRRWQGRRWLTAATRPVWLHPAPNLLLLLRCTLNTHPTSSTPPRSAAPS